MNEKKMSLSEMSGETKTAPRLELNEIMLNGQQGQYVYINKKAGLIDLGNGKKGFEKKLLGDNIKVIFLRIRRKLRQFRKGEKALTTNEHNSKYDSLTLFGLDKIIKGSNDDLRKEYPLLKTNQIVYAIYKNGDTEEVVRLIVRGSSLGSENKAKDVDDFYSYISSFKKGGADDHFYEHVTGLGTVAEQSDMGQYFAMRFTRGEKLSDNQIENLVTPNMTEVFHFSKATDEFYNTKSVEELTKEKEKVETEELETIEYPEEDVKSEDIPF